MLYGKNTFDLTCDIMTLYRFLKNFPLATRAIFSSTQVYILSRAPVNNHMSMSWLPNEIRPWRSLCELLESSFRLKDFTIVPDFPRPFTSRQQRELDLSFLPVMSAR